MCASCVSRFCTAWVKFPENWKLSGRHLTNGDFLVKKPLYRPICAGLHPMATLKPLPHQALPGPRRLKPFWHKAHCLHLTRLGKYEKMRMSKGTTQEKKQINKINQQVHLTR